MNLLTQKIGQVTKTCSARCYNAKRDSKCACICQGKLHAIGEKKALQYVREVFLAKQPQSGAPEVSRRAQREIKRQQEKFELSV